MDDASTGPKSKPVKLEDFAGDLACLDRRIREATSDDHGIRKWNSL